jgi:hypothetical protein
MSKIEVNAVEPQCGTTLTLGASGDTVTLGSGASQSGFGRTGTVDWQTGSIKTSTFTAANGEGYFANTSSGGFTMNLPAGSAGAIVSVVDYTNTFQTNNLTIAANGSEKIGGVASPFIASTEGQSLTFVYVDGTEGWKNVQDSTSNAIGNPFLQATGGTITTCGNCKIHTFTGPGTFTVSSISTNCAAENIVSYMVVAGGGGGGNGAGGGGGGGGFREVKTPLTPYTASPLDGYPSAPNRITVTATAYPITVGGGGTGSTYGSAPSSTPANGSNSVFSTITSAGGGGGAAGPGAGANGGSGGGGNGGYSTAGGSGNTPPVSPAQGSNGGTGGVATNYVGGGGGGATAAGTNHSTNQGGPGGAGATSSITGTPTARAGGGGGGAENSTAGTGGTGGGGAGSQSNPAAGTNGTVNTGGGGGGGGLNGSPSGGSTGGSGIVVIRYKYK